MSVRKPPPPEPPLKPRPRLPRLLVTLLLPTTLLVFLHRHPHHLHPLHLHPCGNIVLITAARHGSTWFIASAEGCAGKHLPFGPINRETELWINHPGAVRDLTPEAAVQYVRYNRSLKIMPVASKRQKELLRFFEILGNTVPVFVLTRDEEDCYASLMEAKATGVWIRNKVNRGENKKVRSVVRDENFFSYQGKLQRFFKKMRKFMKEKGIVWDEIEYEQASRDRLIVGVNNGCYVQNCNYS